MTQHLKIDLTNWTQPKVGKGNRIVSCEIYPKKIVDTMLLHFNSKLITEAITHGKPMDPKDIKAQRSLLLKLLKYTKECPWPENPDEFYCIPMLYKQQPKEGRLSNDDIQGLCPMSKVMRWTFAKDIYDDYDIVNAHPNFLLQYISKYNSILTPNKELHEYIHNRDETLKYVIELYASSPHCEVITKDQAKMLILRIINGGCSDKEIQSICGEATTSYYRKFYDSMQITLNEFYDKMTILDEFKKFKEPTSKYNYKGATLNHFLIYQENRCLQAMAEKFVALGFKPDVLCYDGLMIRKNYDKTNESFEKESKCSEATITLIQEHVKARTGFDIVLKHKIYDGVVLNISALAETPIESNEIPHEKEYIKKFMEIYGDKIKIFNKDNAYIWIPKQCIWQRLADPLAVGLIICDVLEKWYIKNLDNEELYHKIERDLGYCTKIQKLGAILLSKSEIYMPITEMLLFNTMEPYLLPIRDNKVVDFRTGKTHDRTPEHMFTYFVDREWLRHTDDKIPSVAEPLVNAFFESFCMYHDESEDTMKLDTDMFDALRRVIGYSMTGLNNKKIMPIIIGKTDNGKSTFFNIISDAIGSNEFIKSISRKLILKQNSSEIQNEFKMLEFGLRIGYCCEFEDSDKFDIPNIKTLTGSDKITYRPMRDDYRTFTNTSTIWAGTNEIPQFSVMDDAMLNRLILFHFRNTFEKSPANLALVEAMKTTYSQSVFDWLVLQAIYYCKDKEIKIVDSMKLIKSSVVDDQNPLADFLLRFTPLFDSIEGIKKLSNHNQFRLLNPDILWNKYNAYLKAGDKALSKARFKQLITKMMPLNLAVDLKFGGVRVRRVFAYYQEEKPEFIITPEDEASSAGASPY